MYRKSTGSLVRRDPPPLTRSSLMEGHIMRRLPNILLCIGFLFACLNLPDTGHAQPWRDLKPIPASTITWHKGFIGMVNQDKTRLYHLTGRGGLGMPFLAKGPTETELDARAAYIGRWLERHPNAIAVPVEAYPFFSKTVARIYIWILDGPDSLNLDLVREGFINGSSLMTSLRFKDSYVTAKQVWDLRKRAAAAEMEAAKANKGIWADSGYLNSNPPGKLEYPGLEELARFEMAAERMPDPSTPPKTGKEGS